MISENSVIIRGILLLCLAGTAICALPYTSVESEIKTKMVSQILKQKPHLQETDITITIKNATDLAEIAETSATINFTISPESSISNITVLPISFLDENNLLLTKAKVITETITRAHFVKTTKVLTKDSVITTKDIEVVYENDYSKPPSSFKSPEELLNKRTASMIGKGVYLAKFMIKDIPIIHKGDTLNILTIVDNLEIKIKGKALEEGYQNQKIKVSPYLGEKKTLEGEIIDSQTVRITTLR